MNIIAYGYEEIGAIGIDLGASTPSLETIIHRKTKLEPQSISGDEITVNIGDQEYNFDVPEGKNFFFVIQKEAGEVPQYMMPKTNHIRR